MNWDVEIKTGHRSIVARSKGVLLRDDILKIGFEQVQRALDVFAFESSLLLAVSNPGDSHTLFFSRDGKLIVQHVGVSSLGISIQSKVEILDKDGNLVPPAPSSPSSWSAPLRYYRLSQTASDLYEAYRYLYLAFESLLNLICPKISGEREGKYLRRAIAVASVKSSLQSFVPVGSNVIDYIMNVQYVNTRCKLFHGKNELPATFEGTVSPEDVAAAYMQLLPIWREIAQKHLSVRCLGAGCVTYAGFKQMMDNALGKVSVFYTDDPSAPKDADTEVSPLGKSIYQFDAVRYLGETMPGHVSYVANQEFNGSVEPTTVQRICSKIDDTLFSVNKIDDGIHPDDVDVFESIHVVRLLNRRMPRVLFPGVV